MAGEKSGPYSTGWADEASGWPGWEADRKAEAIAWAKTFEGYVTFPVVVRDVKGREVYRVEPGRRPRRSRRSGGPRGAQDPPTEKAGDPATEDPGTEVGGGSADRGGGGSFDRGGGGIVHLHHAPLP